MNFEKTFSRITDWINKPGAVLPKWKTWLLFGVVGVFFFVLYLGGSLSSPYNSDHASILLEAQSVIQDQNYILQGWNLSTVSYLTTELPYFVAGILLFGFSEKVIFLVTALNYSLLTIVIIYFCAFAQDRKFSLHRFWISFCLSFFLLSFCCIFEFFSPVHIVAFTYCLLSILCLRNFDHNRVAKGFLYCLLLLAAFTGDEFAIISWGIPVAIALFYQSFWGEQKNRSRLFLGFTIAVWVVSQLILNTLTQNGGFTIPGVNSEIKFVSRENLIQNVNLFIVGLFNLFSANFFGKPVSSLATVQFVFRLPGLAAFICAVIQTAKRFIKIDLVSQISLLVIGLNLFEYLVTNVAVNSNTVRYLLPSLIAGILLITGIISTHPWYVQKPFRAWIVCAIVAISLIPPMSTSRPILPVNPLSAFLVDHDLKNGYSGYWTAAVTTVHTQGEVTLRQVISYDGKTVEPQKWLSENKWYDEKATFLVIDNSNTFSLSTANAENTFGKPAAVYMVDSYTILVWNKDISPLLGGRGE